MLQLRICWLFLLALTLVVPAGATMFEEHVTGGTLDETWTDYVSSNPYSYTWQIASDQYVSPGSSRVTSSSSNISVNFSSYATNLVLPDTYTYEAAIRPVGDRPSRRGGISFNKQGMTGDVGDNSGYEFLFWENDLLLGKRVGTAWTTLAAKAGFGGTDTWYAMKVEVSYSGGVTTIDCYVDNNPITWDSSATTITDSNTGGVAGFNGGTIAISSNGKAANYFDDIVVTPEPATMMLLSLGGTIVLLRRRYAK